VFSGVLHKEVVYVKRVLSNNSTEILVFSMTHRFRGDAGIVEVEMVRLPSPQELRTENFADDGACVVQVTHLNIPFKQRLEPGTWTHGG
jgi:hypothetical protein